MVFEVDRQKDSSLHFSIEAARLVRASVVYETGGPHVIKYSESYPAPRLDDVGPDSVLIENVFAGVNLIDTHVRKGAIPAQLPIVPGVEGAGIVVAAGSRVSRLFSTGSRVGFLGIGVKSYAQYSLVSASNCVPVANDIAFEDICAAMLSSVTAYGLVSADEGYEVQPGDHVLIQAGDGGLGLILTKICKSKGAKVTTTVLTEDEAAKSRAAGADAVLRYAGDDGLQTRTWVERARHLTGNSGGFDVVYDSIGERTFSHSMALVARRGCIVLHGAASGPPDPTTLLNLGPKSVKLARPTLFQDVSDAWTLRHRANEVLSWIVDGSVKFDYIKSPHFYAAKVHEQLEDGQSPGKLLLEL